MPEGLKIVNKFGTVSFDSARIAGVDYNQDAFQDYKDEDYEEGEESEHEEDENLDDYEDGLDEELADLSEGQAREDQGNN